MARAKRSAALRLAFLGPPLVTKDGETITLTDKKPLALLAYLAVDGAGHSRDALAELLFPRLGRERGRAGLRQCLSILRHTVGEEWIRSEGDTVTLPPQRGLWVDVLEIDRTGPDRTRASLKAIERLFRGDFLEGFFLRDAVGFESWQRSQEERLRQIHTRILGQLTSLLLGTNDLDLAISYARSWLKVDPVDEEGHRALMKALAISGKRADALRQYEHCREILASEVGAVPDAETEELRRSVAGGLLARRPGPTPSLEPSSAFVNLPSPPTEFIGRRSELQEVLEILRRPGLRLLTLTGPAGIGKTRLAVEAARRGASLFPHGVAFVDLVPLRAADDVVGAIAEALSVPRPPGSAVLGDLVRDFLRPRHVLLLMDNFEHVLGAADHVARLIDQCPLIKVLVTSREPLRLRAENLYLLPPFPVPRADDTIQDLKENEAVALFVDRARARRNGFSLTEANGTAVSRLCIRLEGFPLAIELAAGRAGFLSPQELLSHLENAGSALLSGGPRDMPARHRALWDAIEWSYRLLAPPEGGLLRRLAVFSGGFTLHAAADVCAESGDSDILAGLRSLVEKNLVRQVEQDGEPRFALFVAIQEFAQKRLEESGESAAVRDRHARYYLRLAEQAGPDMDTAAAKGWAKKLDLEYPNIRSAVEWSIRASVEVALRIVSALERYMYECGHWRDAVIWLQDALSRAEEAQGIDSWRAKALMVLCSCTLYPWQAESSAAAGEQSVALWRRVGDKKGLARALGTTGIARAYLARTPDEVLPYLEEADVILRETDDLAALVHMTFWRAYFTHVRGEDADALARESRELARKAGNASRVASSTALLGLMAVERGDLVGAEALIAEGLELIRTTPDLFVTYYMLCSTGGVAFLKGDFDTARSAFTEACTRSYVDREFSQPIEITSLGLISLREDSIGEAFARFKEGVGLLRVSAVAFDRQCLCACLTGIAGVRAAQGCPQQAATILGAVATVLQAPYWRLAWGHDWSTTPTLFQAEYDRMVTAVRAELGTTASSIFAEGRSLSIERVIDVALAAR